MLELQIGAAKIETFESQFCCCRLSTSSSEAEEVLERKGRRKEIIREGIEKMLWSRKEIEN
jgi:hypothetical protein